MAVGDMPFQNRTVKLRLLVAFFCCVLVGCGQSKVANRDSDVQGVPLAVDPAPFVTHPKGQPVVLLRTSFNPTIAESERPVTADALVEEFEKRFALDPEDAFVELIYWGDAPKRLDMRLFTTFFTAFT